jgi:hypothetical protein
MNCITRLLGLACVAMAATATAAAATVADKPADVQAQWQAQTFDISYNGFTTRYSCSGLEDKVGQFLRLYGARKDLRVHASACDMEPGRLSRFARVKGEFHVLVPATDPAAAGVVTARWQPLELRASRPFEMGEGDCELFEQLRPVLEKNFTQREAHYVARCFPNQEVLGSWQVTAQVLRAVQP